MAIDHGNQLAGIIKKYIIFCYTECHEKLNDYLIKKDLGTDKEKAIGYRYLAYCYFFGKGAEKDEILAKKYFLLALDYGDNVSHHYLYNLEDVEISRNHLKLAAKSGLIMSQHKYGLMHFDKSVKHYIENHRIAYKYMRLAFDNDPDDKSCENNLARLYYNGIGIERDIEKAICIWKKLSNKGYHYATNNLSSIYNGDGNYSLSFKYIKMASKSGVDIIRYNYAKHYITGRGTLKNIPKAIKILTKCYENGYKEVLRSLISIYDGRDGKEFIDNEKWFSYIYDVYKNKWNDLENIFNINLKDLLSVSIIKKNIDWQPKYHQFYSYQSFLIEQIYCILLCTRHRFESKYNYTKIFNNGIAMTVTKWLCNYDSKIRDRLIYSVHYNKYIYTEKYFTHEMFCYANNVPMNKYSYFFWSMNNVNL